MVVPLLVLISFEVAPLRLHSELVGKRAPRAQRLGPKIEEEGRCRLPRSREALSDDRARLRDGSARPWTKRGLTFQIAVFAIPLKRLPYPFLRGLSSVGGTFVTLQPE